jgi:hypothetical protein
MRLYIKAEYMTSIMIFRTADNEKAYKIAEKRAEEKEIYNRKIATNVFYHIKYGGTAYQTTDKGRRIIIYHQSTREPGAAQISYFCKCGEHWQAFSHVTAYSPEKIYSNLLKGKYINLKK